MKLALSVHQLIDAGTRAAPPVDASLHAALLDGAQTARVPFELLNAIAWVESRHDPAAHHELSGRTGLMGLAPSLARHLGADARNPLQAAVAAATWLRQLYEHLGESWELAVAAYSWGVGRVSDCPDGNGWPSELRRYVVAVWRAAGWSIPAHDVVVLQRAPS